ncbi:MAG TPA: FxsA family protein [Candidatus Thermoplasmatota archaeon]|nr:FxsA family protein [Candidatus Thermoplasmatota archaeon]
MGLARRFLVGAATVTLVADPVASWFITERLVGGTFGEVLVVAVAWFLLDVFLGAWVVRLGGVAGMVQAGRAFAKGEGVEDSLVNGLLNLAAGLLLIWPGILSDGLAVLLVLPPVRWAARRYARKRGAFVTGPVGGAPPPPPPGRPGSIEVDDYKVE